MNEGFTVTTEIEGGVHALAVAGELDHATADALRDPLEKAIAGGARAVLVDLSDCGFIDSTGLSVLVEAHRRLADENHGGRFTICCPDSQVRRLLKITGLDREMGVFPGRDEALASLRR